MPVTENDRAELLRLRDYVEEFGRLLQLHARTPDGWKYFQTEWMWRYVRGLVDGRTAKRSTTNGSPSSRSRTQSRCVRRQVEQGFFSRSQAEVIPKLCVIARGGHPVRRLRMRGP